MSKYQFGKLSFLDPEDTKFSVTKDCDILNDEILLDINPAYINEFEVSFKNEGNSVKLGDKIHLKQKDGIVWTGLVSKIEPISDTETKINVVKYE